MQVDNDASTAFSKPAPTPAFGSSVSPRKVIKFSCFIIESPKPKEFQAKVGFLLLYLMVSLFKCLFS